MKGELPDSMEAAAVLDMANEGIERLLSVLYPDRRGLHASDITDPSFSRFRKIQARRLMVMGYYVEAKWLATFYETGFLIYPRHPGSASNRSPLKTEINGREILYSPDAVIRMDDSDTEAWHQIRPSDYIIEIKSVGEDVYKAVKMRQGPFCKHFLRTEMYLHFSGCYRGFIIYENRDDCEPYIVPVGPMGPERRKEIHEYVAQKSEPFAEEVPTDAQGSAAESC